MGRPFGPAMDQVPHGPAGESGPGPPSHGPAPWTGPMDQPPHGPSGQWTGQSWTGQSTAASSTNVWQHGLAQAVLFTGRGSMEQHLGVLGLDCETAMAALVEDSAALAAAARAGWVDLIFRVSAHYGTRRARWLTLLERLVLVGSTLPVADAQALVMRRLAARPDLWAPMSDPDDWDRRIDCIRVLDAGRDRAGRRRGGAAAELLDYHVAFVRLLAACAAGTAPPAAAGLPAAATAGTAPPAAAVLARSFYTWDQIVDVLLEMDVRRRPTGSRAVTGSSRATPARPGTGASAASGRARAVESLPLGPVRDVKLSFLRLLTHAYIQVPLPCLPHPGPLSSPPRLVCCPIQVPPTAFFAPSLAAPSPSPATSPRLVCSHNHVLPPRLSAASAPTTAPLTTFAPITAP